MSETLRLILYGIALAIAILNALGKGKQLGLWVAVAIIAAIPFLEHFIH